MKNPRHFKRALITGISGSGGSYLAEYIRREHSGVAVHGTTRWHSTTNARNLEAIGGEIFVHECDLMDFSSVLRVLLAVKPDVIFHLASFANVLAAFDTPIAAYQNNVMATINLLEAIRAANIDPLIQLCSSSEVYGQADADQIPIREDCPMRPNNPYAASKAAQDVLGHAYWKSYGLKVVRTRMFTYFNPRRHDLFATAFALQVARVEVGLQDTLRHGNLQSRRTIIDVRDAVIAYWAAAERGEVGEVYNIGGDNEVMVGTVLESLKVRARRDIPSREDAALLRPVDLVSQVPDSTKFRSATGWAPQLKLDASIDILLSYCRSVVQDEMTHCK
ncbi:GDP-mannose 4,6-dehydratase [Alphaproteobacteria bacterium]|nr:GDP-mannose 4,6-dehydratase [Alphaproteobacteria bacterium]